MRKDIGNCPKCEKAILVNTEYRMVLMMGPKGFRRYAVHPQCAGDVAPARTGGRQYAKKKAVSSQRSAEKAGA